MSRRWTSPRVLCGCGAVTLLTDAVRVGARVVLVCSGCGTLLLDHDTAAPTPRTATPPDDRLVEQVSERGSDAPG